MTMDSELGSADDALRLAAAYQEARNYRRAIEVLTAALTHDPQHPELLAQLANSQHGAGDNTTALHTAQAAMAAAPGDGVPMRIYASILSGLGRHQEAVRWGAEALKTHPGSFDFTYEYGRMLVNAGRGADALPVVTEALTMNPGSPDAHILMGTALDLVKRRKESTAEYEEALRLDPGNATALHNLAVNDANSRKFSKAFEGFRNSAQMDPVMGDAARAAIADTMRSWLGWVAFGAWLVMNLAVRTGDNPSVTRAVAGCGAVALGGLLVWVARSVPPRTWRSILRLRSGPALALYIGMCVLVFVVLGAYAARMPMSIWVLFGVMLFAVATTWIAPFIERRR